MLWPHSCAINAVFQVELIGSHLGLSTRIRARWRSQWEPCQTVSTGYQQAVAFGRPWKSHVSGAADSHFTVVCAAQFPAWTLKLHDGRALSHLCSIAVVHSAGGVGTQKK